MQLFEVVLSRTAKLFWGKSELHLPPMDADELSFYVNFISVKNVELCGGFATQSMFK